MKVSKIKDTVKIKEKTYECVKITYEEDLEFVLYGEKLFIKKGSKGPTIVGNENILDNMTTGYVSEDTIIFDPSQNLTLLDGTVILKSKIFMYSRWACLKIANTLIIDTKIEMTPGTIRSVKIEKSQLINTEIKNAIIITETDAKNSKFNNVAASYVTASDSTITNVDVLRSVIKNVKIIKDKESSKNGYIIIMANVHNLFDIAFFPDEKFHKFGYASAWGWIKSARAGVDEAKYEFDEDAVEDSVIFSVLKNKDIIENSSNFLAENLVEIIYQESRRNKKEMEDMYIHAWSRNYTKLILEYLLCHYNKKTEKDIANIERKMSKIDLFNKKIDTDFSGIIDIESLESIFEYMGTDEENQTRYINFLKSKNIIVFDKRTLKEV